VGRGGERRGGKSDLLIGMFFLVDTIFKGVGVGNLLVVYVLTWSIVTMIFLSKYTVSEKLTHP